MSFENWNIEELFARCTDYDDGSLSMDKEEFSALRRMLQDKADGNSQAVTDGWVTCSERPPNDKEYVWCWGMYDDMTEEDGFEGYYDASRGKWWASNNGDYVDGGFGGEYKATVTHWMPLPAAPQQEMKP